MIKAVIFDCFGVLSTDAWLPFKSRYFGDNPELFEEASSLSKQSDAGLISYQDFIAGVAKLAGMPVEQAHREIEGTAPNDPLFDYIAGLKPHYKIGFLSNASGNLLSMLFSPLQAAMFDAVAISYEIGYVKPDERAYEEIARRLDVPVEECVFVDDREGHCTGAREAGMQAVWFHDNEQTIADLNSILQR